MAFSDDFVVVTVETLLGAQYVFPDMPRDTLRVVIESSPWDTAGRLILVNISGSVLTVEARIVKTVSYDGEVKWKNDAVPQL